MRKKFFAGTAICIFLLAAHPALASLFNFAAATFQYSESVQEPVTMFLFGTVLACLAGISMRRSKKE